MNKAMLDDKLIPYVYFQRSTASLNVFKRSAIGSTELLKKTLGEMVANGSITEVPKEELNSKYGTTAKFYRVNL